MKPAIALAALIGGVTFLISYGLIGPVEPMSAESNQINKLFDDYFEERMRLLPLEATAIGDHRYDHLLTNYISDDQRAKQKALFQKYLKALGRIDPGSLTSDQRLSLDAFKREMELSIEGLAFVDEQGETVTDHFIPINQFASLHLSFAQLGSGRGDHPFNTVQDYENFLGRVNGFEAWVNTAIANMRKGVRAGVVPPKVLMVRVLAQLEALLVSDVEKSIFYQPVANLPPSFSESDGERIRRAYKTAISEQIIPSYRKLHGFIRGEYLPKCTSGSGLASIPGGQRRYAYHAKYWTTTSVQPNEIHNLGLAEVRRIRAEMEKVKQQVGFNGDLKAFFDALRTDRRHFPFTSEEEVLAAYRAIEARLQEKLPRFFGMVPKTRFEVRATEKFRAATASEEYNRPSQDGSRPGIFYVPVPNPLRYEATRMESLFLHEAIPGHHYQISLQQEMAGLPKFRRFARIPAFSEGWALYAEGLGRELGLYTDPYQYFGMLTQEMHRAIRLVVDTGLHSKGWSREQAIQFSLENEGLSRERITAEIERYMAWPGQALAYKIGQLKILELRKKAEAELGAKFSIRDFHDEVLRDGALPLDLLESKIEEWIRRQQQK